MSTGPEVGAGANPGSDLTHSAAEAFVDRILDAQGDAAEFRVSVVTALETSGDFRVKTTLTGPDFWMASLDSTLRVDDRVAIIKNGPTYVALGRINGGGGAVPIGVVNPFAGSTAPNSWLICDGSAVSRSTYAGLFAVIGTSYGSGDGSSTFNLPNLTNRFPLGSGSRGRGATGGAESVQLTTSQMPSHSHSYSAGNTGSSAPGTGSVTVQSGTGATVAATGSHSHSQSGSIGSNGSDQAHENMPPFQVLTYIIKAR